MLKNKLLCATFVASMACASFAEAVVIARYTTGDGDANLATVVAPDEVATGVSASNLSQTNGGGADEDFAYTSRFAGPGTGRYVLFNITPTGTIVIASLQSLLSHTNAGQVSPAPPVTIQFWVADNASFTGPSATMLGSFDTTGGPLDLKQMNFSYSFSSTRYFGFINNDQPTNNDYVAYQDVTLSGAVPEPATAFLLLGGLGALVARRARRQK